LDKISIHLVYQSDIGRPLTACRVDDPDLVKEVANRAIQRAHREASAVSSLDRFVGEIKEQEATRLENVLRALVPELDAA
jgi:hypothetical protein